MRGKRILNNACGMDDGITPAGAGKTRSLSAILPRARDHPRRCGENGTSARSKISHQGSPPQVRGKRSDVPVQTGVKRITPAGAGKTSLFSTATAAPYGSPPQVRGKPFVSHSHFVETRITPAGAGKTLKRSFRNQSFCS